MNKTETEENYKVSPRDRRLEEIYDMTLENNELLHSLLKREKISNFFKILYWGFIILTALGFYYKFDTILGYVTGNIMNIVDPSHNIKSVTDTLPQVKELINSINNIGGGLNY